MRTSRRLQARTRVGLARLMLAGALTCATTWGQGIRAAAQPQPQVSLSYRFVGAGALTGWAKTAGATLFPLPDGLKIQGSNWDSKIYRLVTLPPGPYAVSGSGDGQTMVLLQKTWATPPFAQLNLSGRRWHTDFRHFVAPGGPVELVVQAEGAEATAKVRWLQVQSASLFAAGQTALSYRFNGSHAAAGWAKTAGATLLPMPGGMKIQGSNWDSKIYRQITLKPGPYVVFAAGSEHVRVLLQKAWAAKPFANLNLGSSWGRVHHEDYRDFTAPGGPVYLVVQAWGPHATATIEWLKVQSPPAFYSALVPDTALRARMAKIRPTPSITRGFSIDGGGSQKCYLRARRWGANLIRLPVYPAGHPWAPHATFWKAWPAFLTHLVKQVKRAKRAGLKVAVDLHSAPFVHFGNGTRGPRNMWNLPFPKLKRRFCRVWTGIARKLQPYRNTIWGFDLLNEPLDWSQMPWPPRQWRPLAIQIVKAIRGVDPKAWVIYEPGPGGEDRGFEGLIPLPYAHVIYSLHTYDPSAFCMQGIGDVKGLTYAEALKKVDVHYPGVIDGVYWDKQRLAQVYAPVIAFQAKWHVPIYVGEFSAVQWAPKKSVVRWLKDAISIFEAHGWSWTYWEFHSRDPWWSPEIAGKFWMPGMPAPKPNVHETEKEKLLWAALRKNWRR